MSNFPLRDAAQAASIRAAQETAKLNAKARAEVEPIGTIEVDEEASVIYLDGEVAESRFGGINAQAMRSALAILRGRHITVRLNSPGGCCDAGLSVYNALTSHRGGLTIVAELAASMGSLLLQAADKRIITQSGMVLLHAPWSAAVGDAEEFERRAAVLRAYGERMVPLYASRTKKSEDEIRQMFMTGDHLFVGQQAVDAGFADEVLKPRRYPKATLAKVKSAAARRVDRPRASHARQILARLTEGLR